MSTLNSKLKKVSSETIRLMTGAGKNMTTSVGTAEGGAISSNLYVGFKQPSKAKAADPYQIQYKVRYRYTAANEKKNGAAFTSSWANLPWRNACEFKVGTTTNKIGKQESKTFSVNSWDKANKAVNTAGDYRTFMNLNGTKIASGYVYAQYLFRIRTFNKKTNKHGSWSTSSALTIYRAASMQDEVLHRDVDGSLLFDSNLLWDTGGKFYVESVLDSESRELLVAPVSGAFDNDSDRNELTTPPTRDGWMPAEFSVPITKLKREIEYGENLYITAYFQTSAGKVKTYWKNKAGAKCKVSNQVLSLVPPEVAISYNKATGVITAKMWKGSDSNVVTKASFTASYEYKGKTYTCSPIKTTGSASTFTSKTAADAKCIAAYYMVPLNTPITFKATIKSSYHSQTATTSKTVMQEYGPVFLLNKMSNYNTIVGMLFRNAKLTESVSAKATIEDVFGREKPFAVFGISNGDELTLEGGITDYADCMVPGTKLSTNTANVETWRKIKKNPGVYMLRSADGLMLNVAITDVKIETTRPDRASVNISMTEVS